MTNIWTELTEVKNRFPLDCIFEFDEPYRKHFDGVWYTVTGYQLKVRQWSPMPIYGVYLTYDATDGSSHHCYYKMCRPV